jgi:hypothetical protein
MVQAAENGNGKVEATEDDALVVSKDRKHPANLICELCAKFYTLGWVSTQQRSTNTDILINSI